MIEHGINHTTDTNHKAEHMTASLTNDMGKVMVLTGHTETFEEMERRTHEHLAADTESYQQYGKMVINSIKRGLVADSLPTPTHI